MSIQWKSLRFIVWWIVVCDSFFKTRMNSHPEKISYILKINRTIEYVEGFCSFHSWAFNSSQSTQTQTSKIHLRADTMCSSFMCSSGKRRAFSIFFDSHELKWMLFTNLQNISSFHCRKVFDDTIHLKK